MCSRFVRSCSSVPVRTFRFGPLHFVHSQFGPLRFVPLSFRPYIRFGPLSVRPTCVSSHTHFVPFSVRPTCVSSVLNSDHSVSPYSRFVHIRFVFQRHVACCADFYLHSKRMLRRFWMSSAVYLWNEEKSARSNFFRKKNSILIADNTASFAVACFSSVFFCLDWTAVISSSGHTQVFFGRSC